MSEGRMGTMSYSGVQVSRDSLIGLGGYLNPFTLRRSSSTHFFSPGSYPEGCVTARKEGRDGLRRRYVSIVRHFSGLF
jgi:hypothetical protein